MIAAPDRCQPSISMRVHGLVPRSGVSACLREVFGSTTPMNPVFMFFDSVVLSRQARCRGAMNSGPTGSVIASLRMRSILARVAAPSYQPATPSAASIWSGWRAPQSATLMPWSSIQRTASWITRRW